MTNFSGASKSKLWIWLSPERAVLILPIFAGLALSAFIASALITPLSLRLGEQQEIVDKITTKKDNLPRLRKNLEKINDQHVTREQQLDRLLNLIAGTSQLNTLFSELNAMAARHRVFILTAVPGKLERFSESKNKKPLGKEKKSNKKTSKRSKRLQTRNTNKNDSLLAKGLEKRAADLKVLGTFPDVMAFLRDLERLQVFVVISDMEMQSKALRTQANSPAAMYVVSMSLKLSAYGRQNKSFLDRRIN